MIIKCDSIFQSNIQLKYIWPQVVNLVKLAEKNMHADILLQNNINGLKGVLNKIDGFLSGYLLHVIIQITFLFYNLFFINSKISRVKFIEVFRLFCA